MLQKEYIESRGTAPVILNLSTRWEWVVNFMPWLLYHKKNTGAHWRGSWVGLRAGLSFVWDGEEKILLLLAGLGIFHVIWSLWQKSKVRLEGDSRIQYTQLLRKTLQSLQNVHLKHW